MNGFQCIGFSLFQLIVDDYDIELFGKTQFELGLGDAAFDDFRCIGSTTYETLAKFLDAWRLDEKRSDNWCNVAKREADYLFKILVACFGLR